MKAIAIILGALAIAHLIAGHVVTGLFLAAGSAALWPQINRRS